ncbi:hypothetical protein KAR91_56020 [Candidatus Pacearchaeota archaeon]|nr:hypothetical protein [Candidatus Pacearchaeota archaeon]
MTMEFEVKNTSSNYVGKVKVMGKLLGDDPDLLAEEHILKPGESVKLYAWTERYLIAEEVKEITQEEIDGTDESESGVNDTEQPT